MGLTTSIPQVILCLDIDGTLLDSNGQVHPIDIQVLQHIPQDVQLILNTGRPLHSAKPVLQKNGLFSGKNLHIPGVFMNGGVAYLPEEKLCLEHRLDRRIVQTIHDFSFDFPRTEFVFFTVSEAFLANQTSFGNRIVDLHHINAIGGVCDEILENTIKIMALNENQKTLKRLREKSKTLKAEMSFSLPYIFEFNPPGVTKGSTLLQLVDKLGLTDRRIFVAGDGENDLPLFRLAHRSFAPDTAHPAVQERADQIISRKENGLLKPILEQIYEFGSLYDYPKRPEI